MLGTEHRWGYLNWAENSLLAPMAERKYAISPRFVSAGPFGNAWIREQRPRPGRPEDPLASVQLAPVQLEKSGLYGYIDRRGYFYISPQYEFACEFSDGRASVKVDGRYRVIDSSGKFIIEQQYDWIGPYRFNRALVRLDNRYGYADETGAVVIAPQYDAAESFSEGLAMVRQENTVSYINTNGEVRFSLEGIASAGSFHSGLAWVQTGDSVNYVRRDGTLLSESGFKRAMPFDRNFAMVSDNNRDWLIDRSGRNMLGGGVQQILSTAPYQYLAMDNDSTKLFRPRRQDDGSWQISVQASASGVPGIQVDFESTPQPVEVYRTYIWEYLVAKHAGDVMRILTLNNKLGQTETSRPFSKDDGFAIIFVNSGKVCDVQFWYPDTPNPVDGQCQ
ncbi:MAG: WG repeat-containing protein [Fuerstiella sp.]